MTSKGAAILRTEDKEFLTGSAKFVADVSAPQLEGAAHVAFVRSTMAHGVLNSVDTSAALNAPGVVTIVDASNNTAFPSGGFAPMMHAVTAQPLYAEGKVRYVGQPIAAVVAETYEQAVDAAEMVIVDIDPLDAVMDYDDALNGSINLFEEGDEPRLSDPPPPAEGEEAPPPPPFPNGNVIIDLMDMGMGIEHDPSKFEAEVVLRQSITNPRQSNGPIEPRGVVCGFDDDGDCHVWLATQMPHGYLQRVAMTFGLPMEKIHIIAGPNVGGAFGGKATMTAEEWAIPGIAMAAGRPVRWIETRSEYLLASSQGRGERYDFTLAGDKEGNISALRADGIKDSGAYPNYGALMPMAYTFTMASGCYDIAHVEFNAKSIVTNRTITVAQRGAGRGGYIASLERMIDIYAAEIGMDPAEVRRKNLIAPGDMPFTTKVGSVYDEADYPGDLERALEIAGYDELRAEQARRREAGDRKQLGIGLATYLHVTVGMFGQESASVTIEDDGSASVITGTTSQGQGHKTVWAQIASDVLHIPVEKISVSEGSTDAIAFGIGAAGSRSIQTAGVAVHDASNLIVENARQLAAAKFEAAVEDVVLTNNGEFHVAGSPAVSVSWAALAAGEEIKADDAPELSCVTMMDNEGKNTFPSGTHVAVVELDTRTGKADLIKFVGVDDAGSIVNPMIVEGQLHGGIAAGVGQALCETVRYDADGTPKSSNFADYWMPTSDLLPDFDLEPKGTATSFNELGVKAVGESGTVGAAPAVHNAVLDALRPSGVSHLDMPCTPSRVWEAMRSDTPIATHL